MINIVCLKWGTKFSTAYVNNLYAGFKRNTTIPFKFHCFTDDSTNLNEDINIHRLKYELEGWWNKLYLFSDNIDITGRIFYSDLDVLITGNIDHILLSKGSFITLRDWFPARKNPRTADMNSTLMLFDSGSYVDIWSYFISNPQAAINSIRPHGDQRWIQKFTNNREFFQDKFPGEFVSYKVHCANGLPTNTRFVCYHGKPSIVESINKDMSVQGYELKASNWVREYWRE